MAVLQKEIVICLRQRGSTIWIYANANTCCLLSYEHCLSFCNINTLRFYWVICICTSYRPQNQHQIIHQHVLQILINLMIMKNFKLMFVLTEIRFKGYVICTSSKLPCLNMAISNIVYVSNGKIIYVDQRSVLRFIWTYGVIYCYI